MFTNPGVTTHPCAGMTSAPGATRPGPTAAITPSRIRMSAPANSVRASSIVTTASAPRISVSVIGLRQNGQRLGMDLRVGGGDDAAPVLRRTALPIGHDPPAAVTTAMGA